jgi:serine/threonine-protein kinase RsbW
MVSLDIEDDGVAFNPFDAPQHVQPASLEEANIGGLGIALMRRLMDECTYARRGGRNVLEMAAIVPQSGNL